MFRKIAVLAVTIGVLTPASAHAITDRLTANSEAVEVANLPAGTTAIHTAIMTDGNAGGIKYLDVPLSAFPYKPPADHPWVDVQARVGSSNVGNWASSEPGGKRLQTIPGGVVKEPPKEEPPVEEPPKEEPPPPPPSSMIVGVDAGGWKWESAVRDFSGAVKYVRSEAGNYGTDSQMGLLARYSVHLMPLFNQWSTSGIVAWFQRYGHGGTFWAGKPDLGATTLELVNEPGNPVFWGSGARSDQPKYAALIEETAKALEALPAANRPRILVSYDGGFEGDNYGRVLLADDPHIASLNVGYTVHPYGGVHNRELSALGNRPRVTESRRPVYVTEVGWPTCGQTGDSLNWSESEQASNITTFAKWGRSLGYMAAFVSFNYADYSGNCYGIVHSSGSPHKLSWAALHQASLE